MNPVVRLLTELFPTLEGLSLRYLVGGSFASGAWGNPRQTNDLDIALQIDHGQVDAFVEALTDSYYVNPDEIYRTLGEREEYRSFQLLHKEAFFKVDVFVPPLDEYRLSEFERARPIQLIEGVWAVCSAAENVVIQKLRSYELGNRVSDRQWNDIVQVLEIQKGNLDEGYLRHWAAHFGIEELLREAQSQVRA